MRLFNKEKDFILRVINLIFVVWIIVALVICYNGLINLVVKKPLESYSVYKEKNCNFKECDNESKCTTELDDETTCKARYEIYKKEKKDNNLRYIRNTISPLLSLLTVGTTLYLLNKKQKKVK